METLKRELNRIFGGRRRQPAKPRLQRSGVGAARLRAHPRVWFVDGRDQGFEDWFITLRPGWHVEDSHGEHCFGESTLRECMRRIEAAKPCDCEQCQRELAGIR